MHVPPCTENNSARWPTIVISAGVLVALGGHVFATLAYLSPPNIAKEWVGSTVSSYIKPLFEQNWHLFSPNPGISTRKLALRCGTDDESMGTWFDPLEGLVVDHYDNRFSGTGKLLYVYRAIGEDLRRSVDKHIVTCQKRKFEAAQDEGRDLAEAGQEIRESCSADALMPHITRSREFALATRYAHQICGSSTTHHSSAQLQFKLIEFFPLKYADRDEADAEGRRWDKVTEIEFPIVKTELPQ